MCTLLIARHVFKGYPLVIAANRDELFSRPSLGLARNDIGARQVLCPKDEQRGGTWYGVNDRGVFVGITNRADVGSLPDRKSRGHLVTDALSCHSAGKAAGTILQYKGEEYNGFHLYIADRKHAYLVVGDGKTISWRHVPLMGLFAVTNLGYGGETGEMPTRVANLLDAWDKHRVRDRPVAPESFNEVLGIHEARHGTCIQMPDHDYGSRSSGVLAYATDPALQWRAWHREVATVGEHVCGASYGEPMTLAIRNRKGRAT